MAEEGTKAEPYTDRARALRVPPSTRPNAPDRPEDFLMGRSARGGVAQTQENIVRAGGLMPAMKLADTRLRITQDEPILGQIVQGKLRL